MVGYFVTLLVVQ